MSTGDSAPRGSAVSGSGRESDDGDASRNADGANDHGAPNAATLPGSVRAGYAAGSLATGAFSTVPGLLLLPYFTDTIGIGAGLAGVLVLVPKAWDVVFNPIAGRISDATRGRWGPRRPYLLFAGIAVAIFFAGIFAHPNFGTVGVAMWVVALFVLTATAYAMFQVPYIAFPTEMTTSRDERTRLMTRRVAVLAIAILVSGAVAPAIKDAVGGISGYRVMGIAVGALILLGAVWSFAGTARAPRGTPGPSATSWREMLAAVRAAPRFARLLIFYIVQAIGIGTMLAGVAYVATDIMESASMQTVLFASFIGPALLFMPVWQVLAARWSKVGCLVAASVLYAGGAIGIAVTALLSPRAAGHVGSDDVYTGAAVVPIICFVVLAGIGYAGQQVFSLSLLSDLSADAEADTGHKRAGIFSGMWTAGETFGFALGPGIYGLVLAIGAYVSHESGVTVIQPTSAIIAIAVGFTVIPAICLLAPLGLLRGVQPATDQPTTDQPTTDQPGAERNA